MDIKIKDDGDLDIEDGDMELVTGNDAVRQHLLIRLRTFLGEWFLDTRVGIPYFDEILRKNPDSALVRSIFRQAILTTPGIDDVPALTVSIDSNRLLTLEFEALLSDGVVLAFPAFVIEV